MQCSHNIYKSQYADLEQMQGFAAPSAKFAVTVDQSSKLMFWLKAPCCYSAAS